MSNEQNTNNDNDLSKFFTQKINDVEEVKNDKEVEFTNTSDDQKTPSIQTTPELFKSSKDFEKLEKYFKDSHEQLTKIFNELGNGEISSNLDYQQRDELIKKLDDYQEDATQKFQKAIILLSEDITNLKRLKIKSNVNTDNLKSLVYGSPTFKSSYNAKSNIFKDPSK